jgi:hypothetical protein
VDLKNNLRVFKMSSGKVTYKYREIVKNIFGDSIDAYEVRRDMQVLKVFFNIPNIEDAKVKLAPFIRRLQEANVYIVRSDYDDHGYLEIRLTYVKPPAEIINPILAVKRIIFPNNFDLPGVPTETEYHKPKFMKAAMSVARDGKVFMVWEHWFYGPGFIEEVKLEEAFERWKSGWKLLHGEEEAKDLARRWNIEIKYLQ